MTGSVLDGFHPAVSGWFTERFADGPTEPQLEAWPQIARGHDVLVAAPTGTGKTLTGFLVAIDAAYKAAEAGEAPPDGVEVLYLSPLRALAADVHENLDVPLAGIAAKAAELGTAVPEVTTAVRTGDTPASVRAAMVRKPPRILCTTPESLFLLLTSASGRSMLTSVRTVIVDEIHALARDKRGSHLAVSLERLDDLVAEQGARMQRIGLSATQRPLAVVARMLSGIHEDRDETVILDCVRTRRMNVALVLPDDELDAVASRLQLEQVLAKVARIVTEHRTTLVFVNTRRQAERFAHLLAERLSGEDYGLHEPELLVAAHHGSLSADRRQRVEARLRAGDLRALVATASLELGLDVGPVEMVCQIGSPRAISTFLQRVGRANHSVGGVPAGRLFPMTRDELVECVALLDSVSRGELDVLQPHVAPLDIAVQHMVAEVAAREEMSAEDLFGLLRRSAPFAELSRADFDETLDLAARGILTGRGRRGAHLHYDEVNGVVRPAKGARLAALLGGGAIPETGDYRVVLDPDGTTLGAVNEDFAIESSAGDVFLLGTHSWRVTKVETGTVRVVDAAGAAPTVPFWIGEAPARTRELSNSVGRLRRDVEEALDPEDRRRGRAHARSLLEAIPGVGPEAAAQAAAYLDASHQALGRLPTHECIVVERFFDDVDATQLVVHAPLGGRINRALGLALRKRFCVTFDFELQAAADDDAVTIALGPHHSFPLHQLPSMLNPDTLREVLVQAVLPHPMLASRWRWNLNRALIVARSLGSKRRPIHLQRMEADDLLAAAWPSLAACQENAAPGPIPVPDHVLVRQTIADVLFEPLDLEGCAEVVGKLRAGEIEMLFVESAEASPLALGILNGQPFTFLDDAPLEERRSRAVPQLRGLPSLSADGSFDLAQVDLDEEAITTVLRSVAPHVRSADELADLLRDAICLRPVPEWLELAETLETTGRLAECAGLWVDPLRKIEFEALETDDLAVAEVVRVHLAASGPVTVSRLCADVQLADGALRGVPLGELRTLTALARLEAMGLAINLPDGRWCDRTVLARLHASSRSTRRRRVETVPITRYIAALGAHSHVLPGTKLTGRGGLLAVIDQLAGIEAPLTDWEEKIFPARLTGYDPQWLDELCLTGEVAWGRLTPKRLDDEATTARRVTPSRSTPIAFFPRDDAPLWLAACRLDELPPLPAVGPAAEVAALLSQRGACFRSEMPGLLERSATEIDEGLFDLLARGLVSADGFAAARSLLSPTQRFARRPRALSGAKLRRGTLSASEGRWSLLDPDPLTELDPAIREELAERLARILVMRWGVVTFEVAQRESIRLPWREIRWALRRLEATGELLAGRFVEGLSGEQFASHAMVGLLGTLVEGAATVAASDPVNLTGIVVPGARIPAVRRRQVLLSDGHLSELMAS